jgi:CXXX repeat peptide maturase
MLESGAVPFCHYENPHFHSGAAPRWIDERLLRGIVRFAEENAVAATFLFGRHRLPAKLARLLDSVSHTKIVPLDMCEIHPDAIPVLFSEDAALFGALKPNPARNLILRLARSDLSRCAELFDALVGKFGRLSVHLFGIEECDDDDLARYADELEKISKTLKKLYAAGQKIEVNVLTDRMMLKRMRNCDAGAKHVTVAPDGKLYVCPAFLYDGESAIGAFDGKIGFAVKPPSTVVFSRAPICTRCDAWHCKRCVWLNRKLTLEYNIPSQQQCLIAHIEREASRRLLKELGQTEPFLRMPRIAELNYRDPMELVEMQMPELLHSAADDPML